MEGAVMATESIQMNIVINDNKTAEQLAGALEHASNAKANETKSSVAYSYANSDDIHKIVKQ